MSETDVFARHFDEDGRYKSGDGEISVVFLTSSGAKYPGKMRFKNGLLVSAAMDGGSAWGYPDESPLDELKFLLHFDQERPRAIFVENGRIAHNFEVADRKTKERFLANFRLARNLFLHSGVESDSLAVGTAAISDALTRGALWLTPKSVEGFVATDFPELTVHRQAELLQAVQAFRALASQVPADQPPTKEQYGNAGIAFLRILDIIAPYLSTPQESKSVENALHSVDFPPWVVNWDYELGSSEEGGDAVWVDVFAEGNVPRSDYGRFGSQIIPLIRQALTANGVQRWPYVRLRTASELKKT